MEGQGGGMKLCEFCRKKPARTKYCKDCAPEVRKLQNQENKKSYRKMGAQGRRKVVKQPFELKLRKCLKCDEDFLSDGLYICPPCTLANGGIHDYGVEGL